MNIRLIKETDAVLLSDYFLNNISHFKRWSPAIYWEYHSVSSWNERLESYICSQETKKSAYFVVEQSGVITGHCLLDNVVGGAFKACYMGFGVADYEQGKGVAYELCQVAVEHAFNELYLHRIMANYMPHNNRSAKLLERLGFRREGLARDYLRINGKWENHVLTSLTNSAAV